MPNNTTDPVGISMDKTIGGWNSEYESEADNSSIVNTEEIKNAIRILSKANLFS